jgi:hypothetical protein
MTVYTPASPFLTTLADNDGRFWNFAYWGSQYVYIREVNEDTPIQPAMGDRASRDDWPYLIDLNSYGMRPEQVTREWLAERAAQWITDRNDDLRKGNL